MIDLANSSNAATNDVDGRMQVTKPGANVNAVLQWKQAQKVSVAQKFLRFLSQDFQIRCNSTFVDQIHILFHDMLCEKNPLTIWFPPTFDPCQIRIKVILIQTSSYFFKHFTLLITSSLYKSAFTLIYILIVNILSANKIYKWPHLQVKTQIRKQSLENKVIYK